MLLVKGKRKDLWISTLGTKLVFSFYFYIYFLQHKHTVLVDAPRKLFVLK